MSELQFTVEGAQAVSYAAVPTLQFRLRIAAGEAGDVDLLALRCQIQVEPRARLYSPAEQARLLELFGPPSRWGETLKTLLWTQSSVMVPGFQGETTVELPVVCTYDFEVASAKYFHALDEGDVPLSFLFSGTVFTRGENGLRVEPVPWHKYASYRMPVRAWREVMDQYFPGSAWIRLRRESFDALHRFKGERALTTWDDAIDALLREAQPHARG